MSSNDGEKCSPPEPRLPDGGFQLIEHTADVGFVALGPTVEDVLRESIAALLSIATDPSDVADRAHTDIEVQGEDPSALLVNLLEEVLFLFDANVFAACRAEVRLPRTGAAQVRLFGEPRDPARHRWRLIVKGITYHGLQFEKDANGWRVRVFLDV